MEDVTPPSSTGNKEKKKVKSLTKSTKWWIWPVKIFFLSFALSLVFSIGSEFLMSATGIIVSSLIILLLIAIAVISDMIGVAVTACSPEPFTAMASRKVKGAKEALVLLKNADKVGSMCNDVMGDICGIVGGAAGASIVVRITVSLSSNAGVILIGALISSFIASLTIFFKAIGKKYSIDNCNKITLLVGRILSPVFFNKKNDKTTDKAIICDKTPEIKKADKDTKITKEK